MHILEQYSLACGVKIKKPFIFEKFFPLPFSKYIVFHAPSKFSSRKYDYWKQTIELIKPYFDLHNIKIVQIGSKEEEIFSNFCYITNGQTDFNQLAYLIKNSILLLGIDSFPIHLASFYDKPLVGLYCNMHKEHSMPYWGDKKNQVLIESDRNGLKPSYSASEKDKTINLIKPEEIASKVLNLLNIKHSINIESLFFGENCSNSIIEMIPTNPIDISKLNIDHINVRMDQVFDLEVLEKQLNISKCCILTNKMINITLIQNYKSRITKVIFFIDKFFDPEYIIQFNNLGIDYEIVSFLDDKEINQLKIHYMDIGHIMKIDLQRYREKMPKSNLEKIKFISSKKTLANNKIYPSLYHAKMDLPCQNNGTSDCSNILNDELFLQDSSFFYIFKEIA